VVPAKAGTTNVADSLNQAFLNTLLDGESLVLAHYCVLGNTPRYRAWLENEKQLVYECQGGANIASENDRHMHRGSLTLLGPDHIQTEWLQFENGKQGLKASFDLLRKR